MNAVSAEAVAALLTAPTTTTLRPLLEGNNISFALGFKHVSYLVEAAVVDHFRQSGIPVGELYLTYALGFDIVDIATRLGGFLAVDDLVEGEVTPAGKPGDEALTFKVALYVERDGARTRAVTSKVRVVLRLDGYTKPLVPVPAELAPYTAERLAVAEPTALPVAPAAPSAAAGGRGVTGQDPVLAELTRGANAFGWRWRIPYFYCHFNERMQMSGFLRVMEEVVDLFLADRGLSIKQVLDQKNWIPVVTQSAVELLDEVRMEEELYTVYTVEEVLKSLLYTSRMDCYVVRDGELVQTATGRITHGYVTEREQNDWVMADLDEDTVRRLLNTYTTSA
ncbi:thioesterase family protein [Micromonospora sp. NPDC005220]|uniref:thioesterase family protein n=1 Tax=Micromonospora sp. NPDC005220 TaxID=3155589 RepID=UPI00339F34C9